MSLAQSFLKPEDPSSNRFSASGRAACTPQKWHPQSILSWFGMRATCKFGIRGTTRVPLRATRKWCVQNSCTCTARALCTLAPFFVRRQVGLAKVHPCTEFGVASSNFTFTGGAHVKTSSSPLARAAGTPQERHPQRILSWGGMGVTCEFDIGSSPRFTCRCVNVFL